MIDSGQTVHEERIRRTLELARQAWGETHPNPVVGALIVESGEVVAEGWHQRAGGDHAEIAALKALGREPKHGAALYVSLEPCSTKGCTGACTDAIIESGIRQVVVGARDPNPAHAGRGLDVLRAAGVDVTADVLADECTDLNLIFNHWIVRQSPFIAAKMATTLDGKFAAASGHSRWVTGDAARADVMHWRRYFPGIAVGANTALKDNPSLTARIGDLVHCPKRFIFDRTLATLARAGELALFNDAHAEKTILICSEANESQARAQLGTMIGDVWGLSEVDGHLDWSAFRRRCAEAAISGVYVEAGPRLATAMIEGRIADYVFMYQAPKFMADAASIGIGRDRNTQTMDAAIELNEIRHSLFGDDRLIRGFIQ